MGIAVRFDQLQTSWSPRHREKNVRSISKWAADDAVVTRGLVSMVERVISDQSRLRRKPASSADRQHVGGAVQLASRRARRATAAAPAERLGPTEARSQSQRYARIERRLAPRSDPEGSTCG